MTKDELIAKQQLEIEDLKLKQKEIIDLCRQAEHELIYVEQWDKEAPAFPTVAMSGNCRARRLLSQIQDSN